MKLDIEKIAQDMLNKGYSSQDNTHDSLYDSIEFDLRAQLEKLLTLDLCSRVVDKMEQLEHPKPKTREEYNERYGIGEGETNE